SAVTPEGGAMNPPTTPTTTTTTAKTRAFVALRKELRPRVVAFALGGMLIAGLLAGTASAAAPNNQACFGTDASGYGRFGSPSGGAVSFESGAGWGHFHQALGASEGTSVGSVIQLHQAGLVPDFVLPNSCNNP